MSGFEKKGSGLISLSVVLGSKCVEQEDVCTGGVSSTRCKPPHTCTGR